MKNLKRLMSVVLSVVMVMSLLVVSTSAATFTDVDETNAAYEAVEVLAALEILSGKEAGVFDPEANIKRSEFAAVVCRAMNQASAAVGGSNFVDVSADHWANGYIGWAASQGIVNGRGNGTFDPDADVSYNEAITMIVRAMGYEWYAENMLGGYPVGYARIASSYGIDKGVSTANANAAASRADVAMLLYNAFDAPLMDVKYISLEPEYAIYDGSKSVDGEKRTLLSEYSDIYKVKATVDTTYRNDASLVASNGDKQIKMTVESLYGFDAEDVQDALNSSKFYVDGKATVIANDDAWAAYQGYTVNAYITVNDRDKATVVAMVPDSRSVEELVIDGASELVVTADVADSSDSKVTFEYYEDADATRTTSLRIDKEAAVYVNNIFVGNLNDADNAAETEFEALASGYYSSVKLLGSDDEYNKIYLVDYEYGIVEEVDAELEIIETTGASYYLSADDTSEEFVYSIYKDGVEIELADLAKGDLLNVVVGDLAGNVEDATFVEIYVTNNVIESSVKAVTGSSTKAYTIDGEKYYLANGAQIASLSAGDTGSFYITIDGYIYDADFTSTYSDNYALILDAAKIDNGFGSTWQIKLLDKNNAVRILDVKDTLYVTDASAKRGIKDAEQDAYLEALKAKIQVAAADANTALGTLKTNLKDRLVTFKESNGAISELVFAKSSGSDRDFVYGTLDGTYSPKTALLDGYEVLDSTYLFSVPAVAGNVKGVSTNTTNDTPAVTYEEYYLDIDVMQVYAVSSLDDKTTYTGYVFDVTEEGALGAAILNNDFGFAGDDNALAVVRSISDGLNAAGEAAKLVTFWQNGEEKTLAIADTAFVGTNIFAGTITAGDVFQYTTNSADEINGTILVYDFSAKLLKADPTNTDDITYAVGVVSNINAKRLTLENAAGTENLAWDELGTNVMFNTAVSVDKSSAFKAYSSTSYIKAYGTKTVESNDIFASDVYVVVARANDNAIVDVVTFKYTKDAANDASTNVADFADDFTIEVIA